MCVNTRATTLRAKKLLCVQHANCVWWVVSLRHRSIGKPPALLRILKQQHTAEAASLATQSNRDVSSLPLFHVTCYDDDNDDACACYVSAGDYYSIQLKIILSSFLSTFVKVVSGAALLFLNIFFKYFFLSPHLIYLHVDNDLRNNALISPPHSTRHSPPPYRAPTLHLTKNFTSADDTHTHNLCVLASFIFFSSLCTVRFGVDFRLKRQEALGCGHGI